MGAREGGAAAERGVVVECRGVVLNRAVVGVATGVGMPELRGKEGVTGVMGVEGVPGGTKTSWCVGVELGG